MKFSCEDDHFYKRFIEQIISCKETTLINDYLYYIQEVHFDSEPEEVSKSTLHLISKDIKKLQVILSETELSKFYANRFLDNFKNLLLQNGFKEVELNIRLGEYREYVMDKVQNIQINLSNVSRHSQKLFIMEENIPNKSFFKKRNQSLQRLCESIKEDSSYGEIPHHSKYESAIEEHNLHESMNSDEEMPLELLTHKRNSGNKSTLDSWTQFKNDLLSYIPAGVTNEEIHSDIVHLHKMISSIKLEHASTLKDIQSILVHEIPERDKGHIYELQQTRLRSLFHKMVTHDKKQFPQELFNQNFKDKNSYLTAVEKRFNSIRNHLNKHLDYPKGKRSYNLNEVFRIMLYTELSTLLTATVKNGNLNDQDSHLIDDYLQLLEKIHDYQEDFNNDKRFESHRYIRAVIIEDLFGRSKFDAMNLFSTLLKKMEETMISTLNHSNYNYAALAIPELTSKIAELFDQFLTDNFNLNRAIGDSHHISNSHVPEIDDLKEKYKHISSLQKTLKSYTQHNSFVKNNFDDLMTQLFNSQNVFKK